MERLADSGKSFSNNFREGFAFGLLPARMYSMREAEALSPTLSAHRLLTHRTLLGGDQGSSSRYQWPKGSRTSVHSCPPLSRTRKV